MGKFYKTPTAACQKFWKMREDASIASKSSAIGSVPYLKTPWVMVSSLQLTAKTSANQHVIFYGESTVYRPNIYTDDTFSELYETTYNRPKPGLIDLTIEQKGSLGAVQEAKVKFKVWTDAQLENYEILFLVPGAGVRVEWGWSLTPDGSDVFCYGLDTTNKLDDILFDEEVSKLEESFGGHYGGLQGQVTNFHWTKSADGGYDCEITVVARGECYINQSIQSKRKKILKDDSITSTVTSGQSPEASAIIQDMMGVWQKVYSMPTRWKHIPTNSIIGIPSYPGTPYGSAGEEDVGFSIKLEAENPNASWYSNFFGLANNYEFFKFVTLQFILTHMLNANLSEQVPGTSGGYPLSSDPSKRVVSKFVDDKHIWVQWRRNQISANPYVCWAPGAEAYYNLTDENGDVDGTSTLFTPTTLDANSWSLYEALRASFFSEGGVSNNEFSNKGLVDLRWLLINMDYISSIVSSANTIDEFMSTLLSDISKATGGIWDLSLDVKGGLIYIVDSGTVEESTVTPMKVNIPMAGDNTTLDGTCIRSFTMESDMTSKVAAQAAYGSTNSDHDSRSNHSGEKGENQTYAFRLYGEQSYNTSIGGLGYSKSPDPVPSDGPRSSADPGQVLTAALTKMSRKITRDRVTAAEMALNEYLLWSSPSQANQTNVPCGSRPMMPIKLNLITDGFTLLKPGDMIDPTFLPKRFQGWMEYMVLKLSHNITPADWETTIECVLRPKFWNPNATTANASPTTTSYAPTPTTSGGTTPFNRKLTIILNPAHGMNTAGKRSPITKPPGHSGAYIQHREPQWSREQLAKLENELSATGFKVVWTNTTNIDKQGSAADTVANSVKSPAVVFALHNNAVGMGDKWYSMPKPGFSIFTKKGHNNSDTYANILYDELKSIFYNGNPWGVVSREGNSTAVDPSTGQRESVSDPDFEYINKNHDVIELGSTHPGILLEWLFMDDVKDYKRLQDENINKLMRQAIINTMVKIDSTL